MKIPYSKIAIASLLVSMIAGTLFLGVSTALGVSTFQNVSPNVQVSPTFTGVDIAGDIDLKDKIINSSGGPVTVNGDLRLFSPGNIDVAGEIINSKGSAVQFGEDVSIHSNVSADMFGDVHSISLNRPFNFSAGDGQTRSMSCPDNYYVVNCSVIDYSDDPGFLDVRNQFFSDAQTCQIDFNALKAGSLRQTIVCWNPSSF